VPTSLTPDSIAKLHRDFLARVIAAVDGEGDNFLAATQAAVPVITGALKASGKKSDVVVDSATGSVSVTVSYGNPSAPYAAYVHEIPTGQHPKYVEGPLNELSPGLMSRIASKIKS